jgi:hypothetical protein
LESANGARERQRSPPDTRGFGVIADKVRAPTDELYDLLDFDTHMTGDALVFQRFSVLNATHHKLERFFRDNFPP